MKLDPRPPFHSLGRAVTRPLSALRQRPRIAAGLALVLMLVIVGGAWVAMGRSPASPVAQNTEPSFTFRGGWTLVELERHIEAGDVAAITAAPVASPVTGQAPQQLLARTTSGQVVPVALSVSPAQAVDALTALGYATLLPAEAMSVSPSPDVAGGPNVLSIIVPVAMMLVMVLLVVRLSRRSSPAQRDTASFRTIMPAAPTAEGAAATPAADAAAGA